MAAMNYGKAPQKYSGFGQIDTQVPSSGLAARILSSLGRIAKYIPKHLTRVYPSRNLYCCI
jgi:hypothetical protein